MATTKPVGSARERLLAAANELFYEEGVHTVGIDRVLERAGVAKASLYSTFGSKEELVSVYLQGRADARAERIRERLARYEHPRDRILSIFDLLGELAADPKFRGCAFVNASVEGSSRDSKITQVCTNARQRMQNRFVALARELGAAKAEELGLQLVILYDGASISASIDHDPQAASRARAMAELLLDQHAPASSPATKGTSTAGGRKDHTKRRRV